MRAIEFTSKQDEFNYIQEMRQHIPCEIWCTLIERSLTSPLMLLETLDTNLVNKIKDLEKTFSTAPKIGNKYIVVPIMITGDSIRICDIVGECPPREPARFQTVVKINDANQTVTVHEENIKLTWPDRRLSNMAYMTVLLLDSEEKYNKLRSWILLSFNEKLPSFNKSLNELKIDNQKGLGAVPLNADAPYFGLVVKMTPTIFLRLSHPLNPRDPSDAAKIDYLNKQKDDRGFGAPFLQLEIPKEWMDGDLSKVARVYSHDGRHRMHAIRQSEGDIPVEVHLFPTGFRRRHMTPEMIENLRKGLIGQGGTVIRGPLFTDEK